MEGQSAQSPATTGRAPSAAAGAVADRGTRPTRRSRTRKRFVLIVMAVVVVITAGVVVYRQFAGRESTDDAQIDGYIFPISARVSGYATRVLVDNNQRVEVGTVLVQLDPRDYEVAVATAKATLANDQASAAALQTNVPITSVNTSSQLTSAQADIQNANAGLLVAQKAFDAAQATMRQAEANDLKAQDDVTRYQPLAAKDEIPQQQYTQAVNSQKATAAAVEAARAAAAGAEQAVTQARARLAQAEAQLQYAETKPQQISVQRSRAEAAVADTERSAAILQQAQLNLQYTTIVAPISGIVGQRSVQPGQNMAPGQQLMTIVPLDSQNIWVTANFKETQLTDMRPGQPVRVYVDTYDRTYDGHVLNIAGASGARYSLLPPENATGNYVKVVQRIPVKIVFEQGQDPEHLLRPGMSVEPDVKVR
jgi:membrane fusion protein (multidrug efflux system)